MSDVRPVVRRGAPWLALFVALWAFSYLMVATAGLNMGDELWFLQVLSRVSGGETLYRDVFFNTTPVSVQLAAPLVSLFGVDIFVVKLMLSGCTAVACVAAAGSVRTLGGSVPAALAVAGAGVVFGGSGLMAPYSGLAIAAIAAALFAVLRWRDEEEHRAGWLVVAGGAVGVAFAAKHSLGVSAGAALAAALLLDRELLTRRGLAWCAAAGAAAALLPLLPVLLQGGLPKLWEYGVAAKGTYVEQAGVSWGSTLGDLAAYLQAGIGPPLIEAFVPWLPVAAGLVIVAALAAGADRRTTAIGAAFTLAALFNAYPRADEIHFLPAAPLVVFSIWLGIHQLQPRGAATALAAVALAGAAAAALVVGLGVARGVAGKGETLSSLPHLRGVWLTAADHQKLSTGNARLAHAARSGPTLVIASDAGSRYLLSGVPDVTPFDFPLASALGLHGQEQVAAAVRAGRFAVACLSTKVPPGLRAREIERAITETLVRGELLGTCRAYRRPGAAGPNDRLTTNLCFRPRHGTASKRCGGPQLPRP